MSPSDQDSGSAAILAGGRGTRLGGANKALLDVAGTSILARQLDLLRPRFADVFVVANDAAPFEPFGVRVVVDAVHGKGVPGGVLTAIEAAANPWVLCLGCDMPFVQPEAIDLLTELLRGVDAVVASRGGRVEPLLAFYARRCAAPFRRLLEKGDPSVGDLLNQVRWRRVSESELREVDPSLRSLENVNTVAELNRARSRADPAGLVR